jgi:precorrin-8X/cobalt-precorrin-8 methylmutase
MPARRHHRDGDVVTPTHPVERAHPIELESFRILGERIDLQRWPAGARAVVARVVHATADVDLGASMVVDDKAVAAGAEALAQGAAVVCDVQMVQAGLSGVDARCYLGDVGLPPGPFPTRSALGIRYGAERHPRGAVVVVGCAPTALEEVVRLVEGGTFLPALVVGVPVGFVGASEAKEHMRNAAARVGLAVISNIGEKGGSAAACAVVHALRRAELGASR